MSWDAIVARFLCGLALLLMLSYGLAALGEAAVAWWRGDGDEGED